MTDKPLRFCIFIILCSILASCSFLGESKEASFNKIFPIKDMNQSIQLEQPDPNLNTFAIDDSLILNLVNKSSTPVEFIYATGIKVYTYTKNNEWVELENQVNYSIGNTPVILVPVQTDNPPHIRFIGVKPFVNKSESEIVIRVIVLGKILDKDNKPNGDVGAFVDVTLHHK